MTSNELDIIGHSLGINVPHSKRSKLKKDKILPKEYYRNHYQADEGHHNWTDLLELVKKELMHQRESMGQQVFHVTDKGKEEFKLQFEQEMNLSLNKRPKVKVVKPTKGSDKEIWSWYKNSKDQIVFGPTFFISKELIEADPIKLYEYLRSQLQGYLNKE